MLNSCKWSIINNVYPSRKLAQKWNYIEDMSIQYKKKATKTAATGEQDTSRIVSDMLNKIALGGEEQVIEFTKSFDDWDGLYFTLCQMPI